MDQGHELGISITMCIDYCAGQILAREEERELILQQKRKGGGSNRLVSSYVRIGRAVKSHLASLVRFRKT